MVPTRHNYWSLLPSSPKFEGINETSYWCCSIWVTYSCFSIYPLYLWRIRRDFLLKSMIYMWFILKVNLNITKKTYLFKTHVFYIFSISQLSNTILVDLFYTISDYIKMIFNFGTLILFRWKLHNPFKLTILFRNLKAQGHLFFIRLSEEMFDLLGETELSKIFMT